MTTYEIICITISAALAIMGLLYYLLIVKPVENEIRKDREHRMDKMAADNSTPSQRYSDQFGNEFHTEPEWNKIIGEGEE